MIRNVIGMPGIGTDERFLKLVPIDRFIGERLQQASEKNSSH